MDKKINYSEWLRRLKYALIAAGVIQRTNYIWNKPDLCEKSWKHFYDDGLNPLEAVLEDLKNQ